MESKFEVIIADDHQLVSDGIERIIIDENIGVVISKVKNGNELLHKLNSTIPSLIILDVNMPKLNGIETMRVLNEKYNYIKVLVISQLESYSTVKQLKDLGAKGYLPKSFEQHSLVQAISDIKEGLCFFPILESKIKNSTNCYNLTNREIEIIALLCEGKTNKVIAEELFLSEFTVETHRKNIIKKTNCKSLLDLNEIRKELTF